MSPKRSTKRKPRSRYQNYSGAAKQLYKDVQTIKRSLNTEKKHFDAVTNTTVAQIGALQQLFLPPQGDGDGERIGDKIKVNSVHMKLQLNANAAAVDTLVRIIIFWEKENGLISSKYDLIHNAGVAALDILAPYNKQNRPDWTLLSDRVYNLSTNKAQTHTAVINKYVSKHTTFQPATIVPEDMVLKVLYFTNLTTNIPTLYAQTRIFYVDN